MRLAACAPLVLLLLGPPAAHAGSELEAWRRDDLLAPPPARPSWVDDAAGSTPWTEPVLGASVEGRRPGPMGALVGYSGLEASEGEALAAAQASAARALLAPVLWSEREALERARSGRSLEDVTRALEAAIRSRIGPLVREMRLEEVERPYGRLHRAAILVDAGPASLRSLGAALEEVLALGDARRARESRRLASTLVWSCGLLGAASIAYALLNSLTSGHFRGRLRLLFLLALGASWLGLLLWKGWLSG